MSNCFFHRYVWLFLLQFLNMGASMGQQLKQFSVASFELNQFDLTARNEQFKRLAPNGSVYAIIKVTATNPNDRLQDYRFNFGVMSHEVVQHDKDELWVYVQRDAKLVTISREGYVTLEKYDMNTTIREGCVYQMELTIAPTQVTTQMVLFSVKPVDSKATVTVRQAGAGTVDDVVGITDETGSAAKLLSFGSYVYQIVAEGYKSVNGRFTLNNASQTHIEPVILKPIMTTITLRTNSDAYIYVDGEERNRGQWTGEFRVGSHNIECRKEGYRTSSQTIVVKDTLPYTIDLPSPVAITGVLSVTSRLSGAIVTVDGKQQGTTPCNLDVVIGRHTVVVSKVGCGSVSKTLVISEGQTTDMNVDLKENANAKVFTVNGVSFTMISIQGGTFQMGSNDGGNSERPIHKVTLSDYMIGETEVTQALWQAVMGSNPSNFKGDNRPVEQVSWNDCQTFIEKLNALTGQRFRLPTEAEWEYASRGGSKSCGYRYSGSNKLDDVAWYWDNSGRTTHDVKTKQANELGLYDMSGNVWEWCQDLYGSYGSSAQTNPTGPSSGPYRVFRGGSWGGSARGCRVAVRSYERPVYQDYYLGLRLASQ